MIDGDINSGWNWIYIEPTTYSILYTGRWKVHMKSNMANIYIIFNVFIRLIFHLPFEINLLQFKGYRDVHVVEFKNQQI